MSRFRGYLPLPLNTRSYRWSIASSGCVDQIYMEQIFVFSLQICVTSWKQTEGCKVFPLGHCAIRSTKISLASRFIQARIQWELCVLVMKHLLMMWAHLHLTQVPMRHSYSGHFDNRSDQAYYNILAALFLVVFVSLFSLFKRFSL